MFEPLIVLFSLFLLGIECNFKDAEYWLREIALAFEGQKLHLLFCMYDYLLYLQGWPVRHSLVILLLLLACAH